MEWRQERRVRREKEVKKDRRKKMKHARGGKCRNRKITEIKRKIIIKRKWMKEIRQLNLTKWHTRIKSDHLLSSHFICNLVWVLQTKAEEK